jgi:DNA modification methylase
MFKDVRLVRADTFKHLPTMPAGAVDCIVTSPPYWGQTDFNSRGDRYGNTPNLSDYRAMTRALCHELRRVVKETGSLWVNLGHKRTGGRFINLPALWAEDAESAGLLLIQPIVWEKGTTAPNSGMRRERDTYEVILHLVKDIASYFYDSSAARAPYKNGKQASAERQHHKVHKWRAQGQLTFGQALKAQTEIDRRTLAGENNRIQLAAEQQQLRDGFYFEDWNKDGALGGNIWRFERNTVRGLNHPCPYPVELPWRCIARSCPLNGIVLDPFMGSGTTIVAAQMLGRRAIGIEMMREHWETAKRRVEEGEALQALQKQAA